MSSWICNSLGCMDKTLYTLKKLLKLYKHNDYDHEHILDIFKMIHLIYYTNDYRPKYLPNPYSKLYLRYDDRYSYTIRKNIENDIISTIEYIIQHFNDYNDEKLINDVKTYFNQIQFNRNISILEYGALNKYYSDSNYNDYFVKSHGKLIDNYFVKLQEEQSIEEKKQQEQQKQEIKMEKEKYEKNGVVNCAVCNEDLKEVDNCVQCENGHKFHKVCPDFKEQKYDIIKCPTCRSINLKPCVTIYSMFKGGVFIKSKTKKSRKGDKNLKKKKMSYKKKKMSYKKKKMSIKKI